MDIPRSFGFEFVDWSLMFERKMAGSTLLWQAFLISISKHKHRSGTLKILTAETH